MVTRVVTHRLLIGYSYTLILSIRQDDSETFIILKNFQNLEELSPFSCFWGQNPKYGNSTPYLHVLWKILKLIIFFEWSQRYTLKMPSTAFQSICKLELCIFLCFVPQMPKYGNLFPDP